MNRFQPWKDKTAFPAAVAGLIILLGALGADVSPARRTLVPKASQDRASLSLDGEWEFRQAGQGVWRKAAVPGCVHLDLMSAGLIPDPFFRDQENDVQWVEEEDWEYRKIFELPAAFVQKSHIDLVCQGLDTFARIEVNGRELASTDNMFRAWRFAAGPLLKPGGNEILVRFASPAKRERRLEQRLPYRLPGNAPHIRKAPYHFGWDWGPRLATCGIWRSIVLEAWDAVRIENLQYIQDSLSASLADLRIRAEIFASSEKDIEAKIILAGKNGGSLRKAVRLEAGGNVLEFPLKIKNPARWWPAGMGDQPLYSLRLTLSRGGEVLDERSLRIGLRLLQLEQIPDAWGTSFRFSANGVPFFAKGGNWIPADSFPPRVTRRKIEQTLRDCAAVHMNMIRVWGGGIYESPEFYDLCDELGIVVWQDFMFAGALFPGDEEFLKNVTEEAAGVVRELRHHPSLALWCGNNECEEGWFHWGWRETLPEGVWRDYQKIFHELLPDIVRRNDPGRPYWPSSPHSLRTGDPRAEDSGDMHVWDVWHGREPFESYQKKGHRFLSEFGFQSLPLLETVRSYALPGDWNLTSPVMEHHQKNSRGNSLILHYMLDRYRMPKDFESLLWLSQVLQAEGMKVAVEHFRSQRPRTMGALYWQINDCWPVASWSGIDYFGRWKALHHYARRFFAPVLVAPISRQGRLDICVVSDLVRPLDADLHWTLAAYDGREIDRGRTSVRLGAAGSLVAISRGVEEWLAGQKDREVFLYCELAENGRTLNSNIFHFSALKTVDLPEPDIRMELAPVEGGAALTLRSHRLAKDVYLEAPGLDGRFEDNFFDLVPGRDRTILFHSPGAPDLKALGTVLKIRTLRDTF